MSTSVSQPTVQVDDPSAMPVVGSQIGRYFLLHEVGRGAMGVVFEAYDPELKREVALKVVRHTIANAEALSEARALAALNHPNVVTVHDSGRFGEHIFIVMELLSGQTLRHWLLEERTNREIAEVFIAVASGLSAVHDARLVHRDVKPENIVLDVNGRPRLVDFGFAFTALSRASEPARPTFVVGTPRYLAPEVAAGEHATAKSDQYNFCIALREAFERVPEGTPFTRTRKLPVALANIVARGTQSDPNARFASMAALRAELQKDPAKRRRTALQLAGVVSMIALAIAGSLLFVQSKSQVCLGAAQNLSGVWDAPRRAAVEAAVMATGKPYAAQAVTQAEHFLDTYASAWAEQHTQACAATRISQEQTERVLDLRMQCLSNRLSALRATTQVLSENNARLAENAVLVVADLPDLSLCADVEQLVAQGPLAPTSELRALAAELDDAMSRASALVNVLRLDEALTLLKPTVEAAQKARLFKIAARAQFLIAEVTNYQGAADIALHSAKAIDLAEMSGSPSLMIGAWNVRASGFARLAKFADSRAALAHSTALLEAVPDNDLMRGRRHLIAAMLDDMEGKPEAALRASQDAVAELSKSKAGRARVPEALGIQSNAYDIMGDRANAVLAGRKAIADRLEMVGSDHPSMATSYATLAVMLAANEDFDEAEVLANRALDICEQSHGKAGVCVAGALTDLGQVAIGHEQFEHAIVHLNRAAEIHRAKLGPDHPNLANNYAMLSESHAALKHFGPAIDFARKALATLQKNYGAGSPPEASGFLCLGEALLAAGQCSQAENFFQRALVTFADEGESPEDRGDALGGLARAQLCQKKSTGRLRAEAAFEQYKQTTHHGRSVAALRFSLARYFWDLADAVNAREQAALAIIAYREAKAPLAATEVEQWQSVRMGSKVNSTALRSRTP